mgnify:CR=1 FL=1
MILVSNKSFVVMVSSSKMPFSKDRVKEVIYMINKLIQELIDYGTKNGLVDSADKVFVTNQLLDLFQLPDYQEPDRRHVLVLPWQVWNALLFFLQLLLPLLR